MKSIIIFLKTSVLLYLFSVLSRDIDVVFLAAVRTLSEAKNMFCSTSLSLERTCEVIDDGAEQNVKSRTVNII